jgi:hypothetical protein
MHKTTDLFQYPIIGFRVGRKRRKLKVAIHIEYLAIGFERRNQAEEFLQILYKLCSDNVGQNWGMGGHIHVGDEPYIWEEGKYATEIQIFQEESAVQEQEL